MKIEDMGFDLDGRPLGHSPTEVRTMINAALQDPHSELVAFVLRKDGDLMVSLTGPPSRETLDDLERVLKTAIKGYRRILRGQ